MNISRRGITRICRWDHLSVKLFLVCVRVLRFFARNIGHLCELTRVRYCLLHVLDSRVQYSTVLYCRKNNILSQVIVNIFGIIFIIIQYCTVHTSAVQDQGDHQRTGRFSTEPGYFNFIFI